MELADSNRLKWAPWTWTYARLLVRAERTRDYVSPEVRALFGVSLVMGLNFFAVDFAAHVCLGTRLALFGSRLTAGILYIAIVTVNYVRFIRLRRAEPIRIVIAKEPPYARSRGERWLWVFIGASVAAPVALMMAALGVRE